MEQLDISRKEAGLYTPALWNFGNVTGVGLSAEALYVTSLMRYYYSYEQRVLVSIYFVISLCAS